MRYQPGCQSNITHIGVADQQMSSTSDLLDISIGSDIFTDIFCALFVTEFLLGKFHLATCSISFLFQGLLIEEKC
jgi:hypothetical protein